MIAGFLEERRAGKWGAARAIPPPDPLPVQQRRVDVQVLHGHPHAPVRVASRRHGARGAAAEVVQVGELVVGDGRQRAADGVPVHGSGGAAASGRGAAHSRAAAAVPAVLAVPGSPSVGSAVAPGRTFLRPPPGSSLGGPALRRFSFGVFSLRPAPRRPLPAGASPAEDPTRTGPPFSGPALPRPRPPHAPPPHAPPSTGPAPAGLFLCRLLAPQAPPSTDHSLHWSSLDNPALHKLLPPRAPPPQAPPLLTPPPSAGPALQGPALRSPAFCSLSARLRSLQPPPAGLESFSSGKVPAAVSTLMSGGQAGFSFGPRCLF